MGPKASADDAVTIAKANTRSGRRTATTRANARVTVEVLAKLGGEPKDIVTALIDSARRDKNPAVPSPR